MTFVPIVTFRKGFSSTIVFICNLLAATMVPLLHCAIHFGVCPFFGIAHLTVPHLTTLFEPLQSQM